MAFSTQKDFFHVPFMNENVNYECKQACVQLKSYDSSIDDRSWARDDTKKSKFLSDLVACPHPVVVLGEAVESGRTRKMAGGPPGGVLVGDIVIPHPVAKKGDTAAAAFSEGDTFLNQLDGLTAGDSLLECANLHLADYQKILNIKVSLEKQLDVSNARLKTASEENRKIKDILASKLDSDTTKDFHNKIQKLIAAGVLSKNEENEMLQIKQKMENIHKAYEIVQAENNYLKRLIEKLSSRVALNEIKTLPETSTDVNYLQKEVNTLRKECTLLRAIEDDYHMIKQKTGKQDISDQDAQNIRLIINERNSLREKCKSLKALQKTVVDLENKYIESDRTNNSMSSDLNKQANYIKDMECEMRKIQCDYEDLLHKACLTEQCLKEQLENLKDDLVSCKCKAQKAEMLQTEIACLRNEVKKRDLAVAVYDCQYKQLMDVVNELQAIKLQSLQDNHTQTCKNQMDDLAFYTCATLDEITKELMKRGSVKSEFDSEYYAYGLGPEPRDDEISRLQKDFEDMKTERDNMCADALKRLQILEEENANFLNENSRMRELMKEGEEKMANMLKKIEHLDNELNKNADELRKSYSELSDTKKLVEDISTIQLQNQQLANAMSAINSRDDEKMIDDLRRQLEEELAKLNKCQLENVALIKQAEFRENELKDLKDLNNKLHKNINRLEDDNRKLIDDNDSLITKVENLQKGVGALEGAEKVKKGNNDEDANDHIDHYNKDSKDTHKNEDAYKDTYNNKEDTDTTKNDSDTYNNDEIRVFKENDKDDLRKETQIKHTKTSQVAALKNPQTSNEAETLDAFVHKHVENLRFNFNKGRGFEKELRQILDDFIQECGFCFCRLVNPKSKLYAICHKLYHCGINKLSFRELAYLHKKIYGQAEQLLPGCLLDMILKENMEEAQGILNMNLTPVPVDNCSDMTVGMLQKCCSCKSDLCCRKSEEMLMEKVTKLEKDIEMAREHLNTLKTLPLANNSQTDFTERTESNDLTYRTVSPVQKIRTKQLRKLKTRVLKNAELYH